MHRSWEFQVYITVSPSSLNCWQKTHHFVLLKVYRHIFVSLRHLRRVIYVCQSLICNDPSSVLAVLSALKWHFLFQILQFQGVHRTAVCPRCAGPRWEEHMARSAAVCTEGVWGYRTFTSSYCPVMVGGTSCVLHVWWHTSVH